MKNDITKSERAFFRIAKNMSDLSDHKHKIGAAVVIKHRIVSTGVNSNTKCNAHQARLDMDMESVQEAREGLRVFPPYIHRKTRV